MAAGPGQPAEMQDSLTYTEPLIVPPFDSNPTSVIQQVQLASKDGKPINAAFLATGSPERKLITKPKMVKRV